jgi:CheY-like chemotaxis protein
MATILVVDDEFGIAELFDAILSDEGHRVLTAPNGKQALNTLNSVRPDLIFLDLMMPVMDGAATLRHLKSQPGLRDIPVVLMSSIAEEAVAERCSGYVRFLRKPFSIDQVIEAVNELAGNSASWHLKNNR